jgi:TctA family transporter
MTIMGVVAWLMEENGFPIAPAILGLVLGEMLEHNFMTSMIKSDGSFITFFERPIAGVLGVITILVWGAMLWNGLKQPVVGATERTSPP